MRRLLLSLCGLLIAAPAAAQSSAPVIEYYHLDALGSVRAVTDQNGTVVRRHDYFPFGEEYAAQPAIDPVRFTAKERDRESGLDYFGARYYAQRLGRFTSVDPGHVGGNIFDPQSWNAYAYARNNPLRFVDPTGTDYVIAVEGGEPFWFDQGFGDYGALDRYLRGQGFRPLGGSDWGYILNAAGQIVAEYSYFSRSARVFGGAGLLADRWLKESLTDMAVGTAMSATGGLAAGAFSGGLAVQPVLGIGRTLGSTLEATFGATRAPVVRQVIAGRQPVSALTTEERALAAAYYRAVASRTGGSFASEAARYNIARAELLEGTRTSLSRTLPEFIRNGFR